jgi:hypothetical protein
MAKVIIQVAYVTSNLEARQQLLKEHGYEVVSMLGNSDALRHRDQFEHADAVVLGDEADVQVRKKLAAWLKLNFPKLRLVAIGSDISEADAAVGPEDGQGMHRAIEG